MGAGVYATSHPLSKAVVRWGDGGQVQRECVCPLQRYINPPPPRYSHPPRLEHPRSRTLTVKTHIVYHNALCMSQYSTNTSISPLTDPDIGSRQRQLLRRQLQVRRLQPHLRWLLQLQVGCIFSTTTFVLLNRRTTSCCGK
jgi:hypothetical protein